MADIIPLTQMASSAVMLLIYLAILVHFLDQKDNGGRLKIILIVAGVFTIIFMSEGAFNSYFFNPEWPFMFTQMVIMCFLSFAGIKMMIDRKVVFTLFIVFVVALQLQMLFISFLMGLTAYIIVSFSFIYSALRIIKKWVSGK